MNEKDIVVNGVIDIETMDKAQEQAVFSAIRIGDEKLKGRLIQSGLTLASEIVDEHICNEVGFDELFPEAVVAVQEAIKDFDSAHQERFNSYLRRCVEERVEKCFSNLPWMLPIDYLILQLHDRYEMALLELYPECPNAEDIQVQDEAYVAAFLGVSVDELRNMKSEYSMSRIESLNIPVVLDEPIKDDIDNTVDLIETIVDPKTDNQAAEYLDELMDCLSDEERYVVCAREGVLSVMERTDEQIAAELGLDVGKVELLYQEAINKIRKASAQIS